MSEKLKILPIGGLREIGKNSMLIMHGRDALMIDCGIGFAGNDDFLDDDFFIPDFEVIDSLNIKFHGVVVTHGHEDHIGAIPYLLRKYDVPVYTTEFPAMLLKERVSRISKYKNIVALPSSRKQPFDVGPFSVKMIDVPHSILEAKGLEITVGGYKIVHTGDFKCEAGKHSPFYGKVADDVDILLIDSTNVEQTGHSGKEADVVENIREIVSKAEGRVIATAFSSNTERIKNIIDISIKEKRTVALMGRSVRQYTSIAESLGYLELPDSIVTDRAEIAKIPENRLTLIVTGSQAEPRSVMKRMSLDMLKSISVRYGDTIFFSSKIIPGNELSIGRMLDNLVERGANLHYEGTAYIHVSGHSRRDELIQTMHDVNPSFIVPVHGHLRFLDLNARIAEKEGYKAKMISDGDMLVYTKKSLYLEKTIDLETKIVSHYDPEMVELETVRERKRLARAGFMTILLHVDFINVKLLMPPRIITSGIMTSAKMKKVEREIKEIIYDYFTEEVGDDPDWEDVEEEIRIRSRRHLNSITGKKPIVYSIIANMK